MPGGLNFLPALAHGNGRLLGLVTWAGRGLAETIAGDAYFPGRLWPASSRPLRCK